jgi:hypothetical protein
VSGYAFAGEYYSDFKLSIDQSSSYYGKIADVRFSYSCAEDEGSAGDWHLALHDKNNNDLFSRDKNLNCGSPYDSFSWLTTNYKIHSIRIKLTMSDSTEKPLDVDVFGYMNKDGEKINCHINEADQAFCEIENVPN